MKKLLLSTLMAASVASASAQLADGTVVPNFTGTDLNSVSHTLYDYLDQGYTVVIDVSATWCSPCWSYHTSGALEDLWLNHGPAGANGVSASTTDDVVVLFIEADGSTNLADLQGSTAQTQGDWITGTDYPIIDDASIGNILDISYFPTMYTVYPDRVIEESGQLTDHYGNITSNIANHTPVTGAVDGSVIQTIAPNSTCALADIDIRVQNKGDVTMPVGATVNILNGSTIVGTTTTTVALDQFDAQDLTIQIDMSTIGTATLDVEVITANDAFAGNNTSDFALYAGETPYDGIIVEAVLDPYGSEVSWTLKNSSNQTVASSSGYSNGPAGQYDPQPDEVIGSLVAGECYKFTINDSYGDGMLGGAGSYFKLKDDDGTVLLLIDGEYTTTISGNFRTAATITADIDENSINELNVFPNPFSSMATVSFENIKAIETTITVTNTVGQIVSNENLGEVVGLVNHEINGNDLEAGIYFVTINAGSKSITKRIVLNK